MKVFLCSSGVRDLGSRGGRSVKRVSAAQRDQSGQGRGRTADLPLFRRTLIPTELPDLAGSGGAPRAVLTGFEPATSTLTGWRALQAALQDHLYCAPPGEQCPQRGLAQKGTACA